MSRSVLMLITVTDTGHISVDIRGPYSDQGSLIAILDSARQLVEEGTYRDDKKKT